MQIFFRTLLLLVVFAATTSAQSAPALLPAPQHAAGIVRTVDPGESCATSTRTLRHWSRARDDAVLQRYGLPAGPHPDYEIDHIVPLCLGGGDGFDNLWPQPRRSIEPVWNAERKDRLEAALCRAVCEGRIALADAQRAIADDWMEAHRRFGAMSAAFNSADKIDRAATPSQGPGAR